MPTTSASAGRFLVMSVMRALEPCTTSTSWPSPQPTESRATMARPVLPRELGLFCSSNLTLRGSTTNSFWPLSVLSFCVATTWPVTLARNIRTPMRPRGHAYEYISMAPEYRRVRSAHLGDILMRSGDYVDGDDLSHASRCFSAGIDGGANGRHIAAEGDGDQAA